MFWLESKASEFYGLFMARVIRSVGSTAYFDVAPSGFLLLDEFHDSGGNAGDTRKQIGFFDVVRAHGALAGYEVNALFFKVRDGLSCG